MINTTKLPLEGIRVVEITRDWAGPGCGMMLCDMGAEVIKIENPAQPDNARRIMPFADGIKGLNRSGYFATFNRGKKDCLLDLKNPEGVEIFKRLVKLTDVVIVNFAPRVMDSLGLSNAVLKEIKPDLIMVSLSGYGATGPERSGVAFGAALEAYSGLNLLAGKPEDPPIGCGTVISDHLSAVQAAFSVMVALHNRDATGEGQFIDFSELEGLLGCLPEAILEYTLNGNQPTRRGNHDETIAPHGCYRCSGDDKWVTIAVSNKQEWEALCKTIGRPELIRDERFKDGLGRLSHQDEIDRIIAEWTGKRLAGEIVGLLQNSGIACGQVYSAEELFQDPHLKTREFFVKIEHPEVGIRQLPGLFAKFSETTGAIMRHDPLLGEHTDWMLHELLNDIDV